MDINAELVADEKQALRRQLLIRRGERSAHDRQAARAANSRHVLTAVTGAVTVCAFLPLASEPLAPTVLDELVKAGHRVLVPVVVGAAPMDWAEYAPDLTLTSGPLGIARPDGDLLGTGAVRQADAVLVPALAVDQSGHRLGRGGGHYDRSLGLLGSRTGRPRVIGLIFDDERMDFVPHDTLDIRVDQLITPVGGLVDLR